MNASGRAIWHSGSYDGHLDESAPLTCHEICPKDLPAEDGSSGGEGAGADARYVVMGGEGMI